MAFVGGREWDAAELRRRLLAPATLRRRFAVLLAVVTMKHARLRGKNPLGALGQNRQ